MRMTSLRGAGAWRRRDFMLWVALASSFGAGAQSRLDFGAPRGPLAVPSLPLANAAPPRELARDAEVYLVSGYEPKAPRTVVHVDRPGRRVLVVLTSYDKVFWHVVPASGTQLAGVLVSSYGGDSALQAPDGTPAFRVKLPYAYEVDNAGFRELIAALNRLLGAERIDGMRGAYAIPADNAFRQPDPPRAATTLAGEQPQAPKRNFEFDLLTTDLRRVRWSLTGPVGQDAGPYLDKGKIALSDNGDRIWRLESDGLEVRQRGEASARRIALPPDFPRFSWAMDLAHDDALGVLTVVTLGGEGFLYRYDTRRERWMDVRSLNNIDIHALAFDAVARRYVAWTSDGRLLFISPEGHGLMELRVLPLLRGFGVVYDRNNGPPPRLTVAPHGDDVALLAIAAGRVRQIWVVSLRGPEAAMTWKAPG